MREYLMGLKGFIRECLDPDGDEEQIRRDLDILTSQAELLEFGPAEMLHLVHAALQGCDGTCDQCPDSSLCVHRHDPKLVALRRRLLAVINGADIPMPAPAEQAHEVVQFGDYFGDALLRVHGRGY